MFCCFVGIFASGKIMPAHYVCTYILHTCIYTYICIYTYATAQLYYIYIYTHLHSIVVDQIDCHPMHFTFSFTAQATLQSEHLQKVFSSDEETSADFAIPIASTPTVETGFIVFKMVALHPDRRSYLQRAFALSRDVRNPSSLATV